MAEVTITSYTPQAIKAVKAGSKKGMIKVAMLVVSQAKALAAVHKKSGLLRNSIMWKSSSSQGGLEEGDALSESVSEDEIIVGSSVEYAIYQEYGTRKMAAQPYLRPAIKIYGEGTSGEQAMKEAMIDSVRVALGIDSI